MLKKSKWNNFLIFFGTTLIYTAFYRFSQEVHAPSLNSAVDETCTEKLKNLAL